MQHLASSAGAFSGSLLLAELPDGSLRGMAAVGWLSIAVGLALPPLPWIVEARVRTQAAARASAGPAPPPAVASS